MKNIYYTNSKVVPENIQPWVAWRHRPMGRTHCAICLRLDKCWFTKANMPELPHHPLCHCTAVPKSVLTVQMQTTADSAYSKYDPYLFNTKKSYSHGKEKMFNSWGYTVEDALWLKEEIEKQCLEKYRNGNYELKKLDHNGQRINITVTIPRKDKIGVATFTTGWMVYPNGHIQLNTPYGDH